MAAPASQIETAAFRIRIIDKRLTRAAGKVLFIGER